MSRSVVVAACAASGVLCLSGGSRAFGVVTASSVVDYQQGSATSFTNPAAALGLPAGDTTFGALTPFNPPFKDDQIVIVGSGGSITLRLSAPVPAGGAGPELGVFSNNGLIDVSADGSGAAGSPAGTFSPPGVARISVSADGQSFVPLSKCGNPGWAWEFPYGNQSRISAPAGKRRRGVRRRRFAGRWSRTRNQRVTGR